VIKSDNGRSFSAQDFVDLLMQFGVTALFSPPSLPPYNGAIEAGNGSLKTYARQEALRHGRTIWTPDDLEVACQSANTSARPWGLTGPSPDERWNSRLPITAAERGRFQNTLGEMKKQVTTKEGLRPIDLTRRVVRADVDRTATRRALQELDYLFVMGGPIRPPLKSHFRQLIS
jgi:transposase InsO family protein